MIQFLEKIYMAGGLFALTGPGPGAFALDNWPALKHTNRPRLYIGPAFP